MGHQVFIRIVFWLCGFWLLNRVKTAEDNYDYMSIISPCRNEEDHLPLPLKLLNFFRVEEMIKVYDRLSGSTKNAALNSKIMAGYLKEKIHPSFGYLFVFIKKELIFKCIKKGKTTVLVEFIAFIVQSQVRLN